MTVREIIKILETFDQKKEVVILSRYKDTDIVVGFSVNKEQIYEYKEQVAIDPEIL